MKRVRSKAIIKQEAFKERIILFLFVYLIFASLYFSVNTLAKYTGTVSGTGETQVAKWEVSATPNSNSPMNIIAGNNTASYKITVTSTSDNKLIKILPNGSRRTYYIDENDGLSKESVKYLCGYSTNNKLSDIALNMEKVYISDNFDITKLNKDNKYIWINDKVINYTDDKLKIDTLLDGYTTKLVQ